MRGITWAKLAATAALVTLAACQPPPPPPVVAPPPRPAPAPTPAPMAMPVPPNSAAPNIVLPPLDAAGRRMTANVDLSPEQALWQLRIGLNVAALSCRGPNEAALVANYTSFLNANRAAVSRAERWVIADQGRRNGTNGIAARDALSTRLYNYFAQPPVKNAFCERATAIMALAAVEPTANILAFSSAQIVQLDQPFVDFYNAYGRYQTDLALWRSLQPVPAPQPAPAPAPAPTTGSSTATAPRPTVNPAPGTAAPTPAPRPTGG